jgi:catechol 2,3-dioxygenase-like lactoylglutathione lyase family enzyme
MNFKINHLQHIGIPVTDIQRSAAFYEKLGFRKVMAAGFDFKGDRGQVAMMQLGAIMVEIYQLPASELAGIRNRQDGHVDHLAFDVDDIEVAFAELKQAGFSIIEEAPVFLPFWDKGCRYFNILGPDGERLEFNQILKA